MYKQPSQAQVKARFLESMKPGSRENAETGRRLAEAKAFYTRSKSGIMLRMLERMEADLPVDSSDQEALARVQGFLDSYERDGIVSAHAPGRSQPVGMERRGTAPITAANRPSLTLAIDFNGVIHDHTSGGKGAISPDAPEVPGAIAFLKSAMPSFAIALMSARFARPDGEGEADMMSALLWLIAKGIPGNWITMEPNRSGRIFLTGVKVPYSVLIDDRAIPFTGTFPAVADLVTFKPWNR